MRYLQRPLVLAMIWLVCGSAAAQRVDGEHRLTISNETAKTFEFLFAITGEYGEAGGFFCCGKPYRRFKLMIIRPGLTEIRCLQCSEHSRAQVLLGNWNWDSLASESRDEWVSRPFNRPVGFAFGRIYYIRNVPGQLIPGSFADSVGVYEEEEEITRILVPNAQYHDARVPFVVENGTDGSIRIELKLQEGMWPPQEVTNNSQLTIADEKDAVLILPKGGSVEVACRSCAYAPVASINGKPVHLATRGMGPRSRWGDDERRVVRELEAAFFGGVNIVRRVPGGHRIVAEHPPVPRPAPPAYSGLFFIANAQERTASFKIGVQVGDQTRWNEAVLAPYRGAEFSCFADATSALAQRGRSNAAPEQSGCLLRLISGDQTVTRQVRPGGVYKIVWDKAAGRLELRLPRN